MRPGLLSVILPVHNGMPYLVDAVQSLLRQTFQDFVVLAIDNGSSDGTREYLTGLHNEKIRYVRLEEKSLVKALNTGLDLAETPLIARMDADDINHPSRFEKQVAFLERNRDIGLAGTNGTYIGEAGARHFDWDVPLSHQEIVETMMRRRNAIAHPTIMFRNEAIKPYRGYDSRYFPCEDYELFLRIGDKVKLANLPERLYEWRIREHSVISDSVKESFKMYHFLAGKYSAIYLKSGGSGGDREMHQAKLWEKLDIASMIIYRKGLGVYLNVNSLAGTFYFLAAAAVNPRRGFHTLKRKARALGRAIFGSETCRRNQ